MRKPHMYNEFQQRHDCRRREAGSFEMRRRHEGERPEMREMGGRGHGPGRGHGGRGGRRPEGRGPEGHFENRAKTFRRKRVLDFLSSLNIKREILKGQLEREEFVSSRAVIEGELKAVELIIEEFKVNFQVADVELAAETNDEETK